MTHQQTGRRKLTEAQRSILLSASQGWYRIYCTRGLAFSAKERCANGLVKSGLLFNSPYQNFEWGITEAGRTALAEDDHG